MKEFLNK